eukprot:7474479-Heterocapsa_arctica.AAC.1
MHSCEIPNRCRLGCGPEAQDSIGHYSMCPLVLWLMCTHLRLPADISGISRFLWLGGQTLDLAPARLAIWALSIQVIYAACNDFRN